MTDPESDIHKLAARKREEARLGGPEKYRIRQTEMGKMLVRDRLERLLDPGFEVEDGLLARFEQGLPGDAVVTLTGRIDGRTVCVIANDFTVKAGTWGKKTFEKITRMQEMALEIGAPLIYLIDSAGARIDEQFESYAGRHAWGNIFYNQIQLSGRIPQLCAMFGPSPAGSAYVPALCDLIVMVDGQATAYIGSPRMAEMATGEKVTLEEMGGARMHCTVSGLGDILADSEDEALDALRAYLAFMPDSWKDVPPLIEPRPPAEHRPIAEIVPERENLAFDMHELIAAVVDEGSFLEIKARFARELITGFARLGGRGVGVVANNSRIKAGVLFPDSSDKAARFVWLCNAFNIPLLFLQDIPGFMVGSAVEKQGMIRHGAKMLFAVCEATVPRIAVMVRKAYGGGYLAMSGSPTAPSAVLALPTARPALMGPAAAINAIHAKRLEEIEDLDERRRFVMEKQAEYEADVDIFNVASDNSIEAVVSGDELRDDLVRRYELYCRRPAARVDRRNGVMPV
ncbi:MAG TPA: acyl-CoA carboxylase subunit beta [Egibacteraceae bacterium]|nr:acyl-CoA carboxylase subunit beta [Egibacteraceae bacterium]